MAETPTTRLQHVVLFNFPQPLTEAEDQQFRGMVASWPDKIGTMTECRVGSDLTGARSRGYQYLLLTVFPDTDVLAAYVAHPVHQEMIAFLDARDCQRLAFDYYLDATTDFC
jgi:Stress responsive A/B Barrel Domain